MRNNDKPYDKCFPISLVSTEIRQFKTFEAYDKACGIQGKWLSRGENHRITEDGYIARDFEIKGLWGIKLNSLKDLLNFEKEVGEDLGLSISIIDDKTPLLEIRDDYIE